MDLSRIRSHPLGCRQLHRCWNERPFSLGFLPHGPGCLWSNRTVTGLRLTAQPCDLVKTRAEEQKPTQEIGPRLAKFPVHPQVKRGQLTGPETPYAIAPGVSAETPGAPTLVPACDSAAVAPSPNANTDQAET